MTVYVYPNQGYLCAVCHSQMHPASDNCGSNTEVSPIRFWCPNDRCVQYAESVEIPPTCIEVKS